MSNIGVTQFGPHGFVRLCKSTFSADGTALLNETPPHVVDALNVHLRDARFAAEDRTSTREIVDHAFLHGLLAAQKVLQPRTTDFTVKIDASAAADALKEQVDRLEKLAE